jgi:hypothetical protein
MDLMNIVTIESVFRIIKIVVAIFSLIFTLLVLRNLFDLQDNYKSKAFPIFLILIGTLIFISGSFLLQFFLN